MTGPERDAEWERQHLHALFSDEIPGCGCCWPADAYNLVRDLLNLAPFYGAEPKAKVAELIGTDGAVHIVLAAMQDADLIDHGTSSMSSWITDKGKYARLLMARHEWDDSDRDACDGVCEAGLPHYTDGGDGECAEDCWVAPDGVLPPDPPTPTMNDLIEAARKESEQARARLNPVQRAVLDQADRMFENVMLYGQHPAPERPAVAGLAGDAVADALDRMYDPMFYGLPPKPLPPGSSTHTGLFDALGGVTPASASWPAGTDATARTFDWMLRTDEAANGPLGRAQWAPADCTCPWPWPTADGHVRLDCPHYAVPPRPVRGRNPYTECRRVDGTWIHGKPHRGCPGWTRGQR
jgi:hypothetical protein